MKIERKVFDESKGIVRITCEDERWYGIPNNDGIINYVPSVTWVCSFYPRGIGFYKWLAQRSWDESIALKEAAGDRGSTVHSCVSALLAGNTIAHNEMVFSEDGSKREITIEEYEGIISFAAWWKEAEPVLLKKDETVFARDFTYAGTLDLRCSIAGEPWLIDLKTSAEIWPAHELQVSAYKHCGYENHRIAILQLGYRKNKKKYRFTEIEDQFDLFLSAKRIWAKETKGISPLQKDYPIEVSLTNMKLKSTIGL